MTDSGTQQLDRLFSGVRSERRAALLPYLTAGLPDPDTSVALFEAMAEAGADGFEIGIPYSDPLMDGPVIAEAGARSLAAGTTFTTAIEITRAVSRSTSRPILLMTYTNPVMHRGIDAFMDDAGASGAAGVIIADLPVEESQPFQEAAQRAGLGMALFAAPTTSDRRLERIASARPAFIYGVASLGVTGERTTLSDRAHLLSQRIRSITDVPLVMGVGISTPAQAASAAVDADGIIVGSALVRRVLDASDPTEAISEVAAAVSDLSRVLGTRRSG
jgi:tryptophan synthase alpha chain